MQEQRAEVVLVDKLKRSFVSYPKSGRTWVRYALIEAGAPQTVFFHHDGFEFNDGSKPALNFDVDRRIEEYKSIDRLVYLERDPRDVMCSLYHQVTGRFQDFFNYDGSISDFIRDPYFGATNLRDFRAMWEKIQRLRVVLKVSYEEMTEDPASVLRKISKFYAFDLSDSSLQHAVTAASFGNMKALEQSERFDQPWLRPRNGSPKVRSGKIGGHRTELIDHDIEFLNDIFQLERD